MKTLFFVSLFALLFFLVPGVILAQTPTQSGQTTRPTITARATPSGATGSAEATSSGEASVSATTEPSPTPMPIPREDITQTVTIGRLEQLLKEQQIGGALVNPLKYAIRATVDAGVPANTIVLLLLLPLVVAVIAAARHVVGLRGFGIFLPAALAVVFAAIGPIVGIALFMVIVLVSTYSRVIFKKFKLKLQYLPRMALILWMVVVGVLLTLFLAPLIKHPDFTNISIFPLLVLVLLAEDFSKVQLGKSPRTAISLASETIVLALVSFIFLTFEPLQEFALLNPEIFLASIVVIDILIGRYFGLRFVEYWRFRRLIKLEK